MNTKLYHLLILLTLCSCNAKRSKVTTGLEGTAMPNVELLQFDSAKHINTSHIEAGKPTLMFVFATSCPFCKAQTKSLLSQIQSLEGTNIYMICTAQYPEFKKFYEQYQLDRYPNVKAGIDYNLTFARYLKASQVPFWAIYDKEKKLKEVFIGKTPIASLKRSAFQ
jgi:hypothetical protein